MGPQNEGNGVAGDTDWAWRGKKNKEKVGKFGEKIKQDRRKGEGHGWQKEIKR